MSEIQVGQVRKGIVKNITDFGAFVDLGGIDGLLHITDMSWGRVRHPSRSRRHRRGDRSRRPHRRQGARRASPSASSRRRQNPWEQGRDKYPVGSRVTGRSSTSCNYGAFVKLEEGIEGLVHISEMSWTRRVNHPSEMVAIGDIIEVVVLGINKEKQEISLGMKQTEANPWTQVEDKYPPGTVIKGRVRNLTNYGAFVEIEEGIDGLLHCQRHVLDQEDRPPVRDAQEGRRGRGRRPLRRPGAQARRPRHEAARGRPVERPSSPIRSRPARSSRARSPSSPTSASSSSSRTTSKACSTSREIADEEIANPEAVLHEGDLVAVKILRVDPDERKIGLSLKRVTPEERGNRSGRRRHPGAPRRGQDRPSPPEAPEAAPEAPAKPLPPSARLSPPREMAVHLPSFATWRG